jgi:hypothetical protein
VQKIRKRPTKFRTKSLDKYEEKKVQKLLKKRDFGINLKLLDEADTNIKNIETKNDLKSIVNTAKGDLTYLKANKGYEIDGA